MFCPILEAKTVIKKIDVQPGIYNDGFGTVNLVSHKWYLINYYNMSGYWSLLSLLTEKLKTLCSIVCHQTVTEQQHQMEDIILMNDLIRKECHMAEIQKSVNLQ